MPQYSLSTEDYLDILRGAFYSVILGIFFSATIFKEPTLGTTLPYIAFLCAVTFYILLDGITRYNDRMIVRKDHNGIPLYIELFLLFLELFGMLILTLWAIQTYLNSEVSYKYNDMVLLGILGIVNFLHNCLIILIDKNWGTVKFIFAFVVGMPEKSARNWMNQLKLHKEQACASMQQALLEINNISIEETSESNQIPHAFLEVRTHISKHYHYMFKSILAMCMLSMATQYSISRLWVFNLLLSIRLLLPNTDFYLSFSQTNLLGSGSVLQWSVAALSIILYIFSSYKDLINIENNKVSKRVKYIANILFFTFMCIFVIRLDSSELVITIFLESALFSFALITIADHSNLGK